MNSNQIRIDEILRKTTSLVPLQEGIIRPASGTLREWRKWQKEYGELQEEIYKKKEV